VLDAGLTTGLSFEDAAAELPRATFRCIRSCAVNRSGRGERTRGEANFVHGVAKGIKAGTVAVVGDDRTDELFSNAGAVCTYAVE